MRILGYYFGFPQWYGWRVETIALIRTFYPHKDNNTVSKLISLVFVTGWVTVTIMSSIESIQTVRPLYYGIYTAIVFLILGRIWGLEVDSLVAGVSTSSDENNDD